MNEPKTDTAEHLIIPQTPIAFFDLDDTLIYKDCTSHWIKWRLEIRGDRRGYFEVPFALINYLFYRMGRLTAAKIYTHFWSRTIGMKEKEFRDMASQFFDEYGKRYIFPESLRLIDACRQQNTHTVMITAQDEYLAHPFHSSLRTDALLSNRRIVKNGSFAGFVKPNCYGSGKIEAAEAYARMRGVALEDCAFYSDSISDLPLLNRVKFPVAVNPDAKLSMTAADKNWPVIRMNL